MKIKKKYKIDDVLVIDTWWGGGYGKGSLYKEFDSFSAINYKDLEECKQTCIGNFSDIFKRIVVSKSDIVIDERRLYYVTYTPLRYFIKDTKVKTIRHDKLLELLFILTNLEKGKEKEAYDND